MRLTLSPAKLVLMCWPVYLLAALGALLNWQEWRQAHVLTVLLLTSPLLIFAAGAAIQTSWWLELTPEALIHHTLSGAERFEWARMGPVALRWQTFMHLPIARTLWFAFPLDKPRNWREGVTKRMGRRILVVFGDRSAADTVKLIEEWRRGQRLG